jgi:hypothetical protein
MLKSVNVFICLFQMQNQMAAMRVGQQVAGGGMGGRRRGHDPGHGGQQHGGRRGLGAPANTGHTLSTNLWQ